jgi:heme oxygenase
MLPLKEATSIKHKQAERMPFNTRMFKGLLSKHEYLLYLNQQLHIFQTIERIGLPDSGLRRTVRVQADIDELNSEGYNSDFILNSTIAYVDYLGSLSSEQILPHVYLNYMAIMFGGQMMKKAVPSTGRMYVFDNMQESIQSIRNVQNDVWAEEVNKGFDFTILIFEELETECNNRQSFSS